MPCISPAGRGSRAIGLAVIAACLISVAAALAAPGTAQAHAGLERSDPPPNAIVPEAPATVTMTFTEPLEWSYTRAELYDESGEAVPGASSGPGATGYDMVLELPPTLPDGTYTVLWRTLSTADGHTARNSFAFTVGSDADVTAVAIPAADADAGPSGWAHAVTRWVALVGLAGSVAAWPVWMFVVRPGLAPAWRHAGRSCRAARRFAGAALGLATAGNLAALAVQASMLDESLPGAIATTLADTRYGELWLMRVALLGLLALLLWSVAWWRPYRRPVRAALAFAVALALPVPFSLIAHASAQETGRDVAVFNDYLHLTAASLWAGGLAMVLAVSLPVARGSTATGAALAATLRRFSTMALVAWGVMVLSGLYSACLQVGGWDALVETGYGRRLLLKLALLAPILGLAAFNLAVVTRRVSEPDTAGRWARRFARSVGTEVALAVAVLLVVGSLTSTAPARGAAPPAEARVTAALASTGVEASLTVSPGEPGPNRLELVIEGSLPNGTEALLRVEHRDRDTGKKEIALDATGEGRYVAEGSELSLPGTWDLELILRPPGAIEQRLYGEVDIARVAPEIDPEAPGPAWVLASPRAVAGMLLVTSGGAAGVLGARHLRGRAGGLAITVATLALAIGGVLLALARQGG